MSGPLKSYKIYSYDGTHNMLTAELIDAANDEEAVAKAAAAGFGNKCEIWEERRLVAQLDAERRQA